MREAVEPIFVPYLTEARLELMGYSYTRAE